MFFMTRKKERHMTNMVWMASNKVVEAVVIWATFFLCSWEEAEVAHKNKKLALSQSPDK